MDANIVIALINTIGVIVVAYFTYKTKQEAGATSIKVDDVSKQVHVIEKATNSMKDALIISTAKASLAEGVAAGVKQEQSRIKDRPADGSQP